MKRALFTALLFLLVPYVANAAYPTNNALGAWNFNSAATDSSGNNETLTAVNSATYASGIVSNGASLTASSIQSFERAGDVGMALTGPFSISLWIKPTSVDEANGNQRYLVFRWDGSTNKNYALTFQGTAPDQFDVFFAGKDHTFTYATSAGTWYHVVAVYNGTNVQLYVNNVAQTAVAETSNPTSSGAQNFWVGASDTTSSNSAFDGIIDEVAVWDRALSSTEVTTLYNSGAGLEYPTMNTANQGPNTCGAAADQGSTANYLTNVANLCSTSSGSVATAGGSNNAYGTAYNFSFSVPPNANITGFKMNITGLSGNSSTLRSGLSFDGGSTFPCNQCELPYPTLTGSYATYSFGSQYDLWTATSSFTPSVVNGSNFRVLIDVANGAGPNASLYNVQGTIYYTIPQTLTTMINNFIQFFGDW